MSFDRKLHDVLELVRPAMRDVQPSEADRAHFLYDLIGEVYDYVRFDVHDTTVSAAERARIGGIAHAALPPSGL